MNIVFIPIAGVVGIIALVIIRALPDESKNNKLYKVLIGIAFLLILGLIYYLLPEPRHY